MMKSIYSFITRKIWMPWRNVKGSNESAEKISLLRKKSKASSDANTNHTFDVVIASSLPALFAASRDVPHEMENDVRDDVCLLTKPFNQRFLLAFRYGSTADFTNNNVGAKWKKKGLMSH